MRPIGGIFLAIMRVFAATVFDDGNGVPEERLDWLMAEYADFTRSLGPKTRAGFRAAILAVQLLPLFVIGVPLPMTWLSKKLRARYLEKLESGPLTVLITATKMPLTMIYFEHPEVMATTGYDGNPKHPKPEESGENARPATAVKARLPTLPREVAR